MIGNRSNRISLLGAGRLRGERRFQTGRHGCAYGRRAFDGTPQAVRRGLRGWHSSKAIRMHSSHWSRSALAMLEQQVAGPQARMAELLLVERRAPSQPERSWGASGA